MLTNVYPITTVLAVVSIVGLLGLDQSEIEGIIVWRWSWDHLKSSSNLLAELELASTVYVPPGQSNIVVIIPVHYQATLLTIDYR
jgi:hypothetical protein